MRPLVAPIVVAPAGDDKIRARPLRPAESEYLVLTSKPWGEVRWARRTEINTTGYVLRGVTEAGDPAPVQRRRTAWRRACCAAAVPERLVE